MRGSSFAGSSPASKLGLPTTAGADRAGVRIAWVDSSRDIGVDGSRASVGLSAGKAWATDATVGIRSIEARVITEDRREKEGLQEPRVNMGNTLGG
ncbi:hypothetical protein OLK001_05210 [Synechocystis sp. LKSZ1]